MSGAGNDFIVLDRRVWEGLTGDRSLWVRGACRRGLSVGADGVLVVGREPDGGVSVRFYNPDGGEAFCGNGTRCAARYAATRGMGSPERMVLSTAAGEVSASIDGERVTLHLAAPRDRGEVVLHGPEAEPHRGRLVDAGVPHVVLMVRDLRSWPLARIAPSLRRDPALGADGANVDAVERDAEGRFHVRTWERGVEGETLACGTGAVAAALAARIAGAAEHVTIVPASGIALTVELPGDPSRPSAAVLTGDARFVFEGTLAPDALPAAP
jgi:diaminopimelate epimerase